MNSKKFKIFLLLTFIYLILFEFIFPHNKIFPSASVIFLSIDELLSTHNFTINIISTSAAVYTSVFVNYVLMKILFAYLFDYNSDTVISCTLKTISYFIFLVPFVLISLLFVLWFPDFLLNKYIVAVISVFSISFIEINDACKKITTSANLDFYKSIGLKESVIKNKILFKYTEPQLFDIQLRYHPLIWSVVLIVEYFQQKEGVGNILNTVLKFHDVSLAFTLTLILFAIVFLLQALLLKLYNRIYFWE